MPSPKYASNYAYSHADIVNKRKYMKKVVERKEILCLLLFLIQQNNA